MYKAKSAILVIIFNRPEQTSEILSIVRKVQPGRLYVAADGARPGRAGEAIRCEESRSVFSAVDWPCEVFRKFSDVNQGSHTAIPTAIDWFFENEPAGIVLEDDCVPNESFFRYCDELLERYESNDRVMWINGSNVGYPASVEAPEYLYSAYSISWGWASWRRAWNAFGDEVRREMPRNQVDAALQNGLKNSSWLTRLHWRCVFHYAYTIKNWDFRWQLVMWACNGLACTPTTNLIKNVGFGINATHVHGVDDPRGHIEAGEVSGSIRGPGVLSASQPLDRHLNSSLYKIGVVSVAKLFIATKFPGLRKTYRELKQHVYRHH